MKSSYFLSTLPKMKMKCSRLYACFQALTAIKRKATNDFHRLSLFFLQGVDFPYKLSNKFIEDFRHIMDFVEHKHIVLKTYKVGNGIKS